MKLVFRAPQGRRRGIAFLAAALAAWALTAASAAGQLPGQPDVRSPVPVPEPVQKALEQPLPESPASVPDTPAGDVDGAVGGAVAGTPSGGDEGAAAAGAGASSSPAAQSARSGQSGIAAQGRGPGTSNGGGGDAASQHGTGSASGRPGSAARSTRPQAASPRRVAARRRPAADEGGAVGRTVRDIVEVVPDSVWVALAVLAGLALALAGRSGVERRRRRWLEREREQLLGDLGLLQSALLPEVPERLGALATSVAYRPADGPAAGGDFYDAFELRDGRVATILGDVSGHGREALVWTASVRHSLRTFLRSGLEPRAALAAAGRLVSDDADGHFVTVVVAVHDPVTGNLTYAAAGHPPPIVCGPGAHEPITLASAPPLGIDLPTGLRQTTAPLPRGSVLCFFTDGLLEARIGDALVGRERLAAMVAGLEPGEGAEGLLARVLEAADEASDDMAACVARALEGPAAPGPRVEELEIGSDPIELALAGEFLEACGVPADTAAEVLDEAGATVSVSGGAILLATLDDGDPRVDVVAPRRELEIAELEA